MRHEALADDGKNGFTAIDEKHGYRWESETTEPEYASLKADSIMAIRMDAMSLGAEDSQHTLWKLCRMTGVKN